MSTPKLQCTFKCLPVSLYSWQFFPLKNYLILEVMTCTQLNLTSLCGVVQQPFMAQWDRHILLLQAVRMWGFPSFPSWPKYPPGEIMCLVWVFQILRSSALQVWQKFCWHPQSAGVIILWYAGSDKLALELQECLGLTGRSLDCCGRKENTKTCTAGSRFIGHYTLVADTC